MKEFRRQFIPNWPLRVRRVQDISCGHHASAFASDCPSLGFAGNLGKFKMLSLS